MKVCQRRIVYALGMDWQHKIASAVNRGDCNGQIVKCGCLHAEEQLLRVIKPLTVFVSLAPCLKCAALFYKSRVQTVMYQEPYFSTDGIDYLTSKGIAVVPNATLDLFHSFLISQGDEQWTGQNGMSFG